MTENRGDDDLEELIEGLWLLLEEEGGGLLDVLSDPGQPSMPVAGTLTQGW